MSKYRCCRKIIPDVQRTAVPCHSMSSESLDFLKLSKASVLQKYGSFVTFLCSLDSACGYEFSRLAKYFQKAEPAFYSQTSHTWCVYLSRVREKWRRMTHDVELSSCWGNQQGRLVIWSPFGIRTIHCWDSVLKMQSWIWSTNCSLQTKCR